jgi:metallo-beta-lactamase family protein
LEDFRVFVVFSHTLLCQRQQAEIRAERCKGIVIAMSGKRRTIWIALCVSAVFFFSGIGFSQDVFPLIRFLGATRMVGGSCCLVDTGKTRLLIDFGLFYGEHETRNSIIEFDPATIDYVLLTHAHIDHAGRIPLLYRNGFRGKILATDATKKLAGVIVEMSMNIAEKQGRAIYGIEDYRRMMKNFMVVPFDRVLKLNPKISVRFSQSGHILGAAIIELWIENADGVVKVVATGDLGNENLLLLQKPEIIREGDYVLVESTEGPVRRAETDYVKFGKELQKTLKAGGSVLIPTFVLDRTQNIIYVIGMLKQKRIIPEDTPVVVDSGTAHKVTGIYREFKKYFRPGAVEHPDPHDDPLRFQHLYELNPQEALRMHDRDQPAIYISSSAMLDHANAPRHLAGMIENPKNLLAVVGWQAPGTPGWKLQRGARTLRIPVEGNTDGMTGTVYVEKTVKMKVKTFDMFSYHADGCQILTWLSNFEKIKKVFVVHGEKENALRMAELITERLGFKASAPLQGTVYRLSGREKDYARKKAGSFCSGMKTSNESNRFAD